MSSPGWGDEEAHKDWHFFPSWVYRKFCDALFSSFTCGQNVLIIPSSVAVPLAQQKHFTKGSWKWVSQVPCSVMSVQVLNSANSILPFLYKLAAFVASSHAMFFEALDEKNSWVWGNNWGFSVFLLYHSLSFTAHFLRGKGNQSSAISACMVWKSRSTSTHRTNILAFNDL